jgi:hypothetical protein
MPTYRPARPGRYAGSRPSGERRRKTVDNLAARARRLDRLALGLRKEVVLIREADDPLLYLERLACVEALRGAVAGLEDARGALAKALQRIREGEGA